MPTCCLAEVGHPKAQTPVPTQPLALRNRKSLDQPRASAPRLTTWALPPASSGGIWLTFSSLSTRRKKGSSSSTVSSSRPKRERHSSSTVGGVRKQVPELISVVPPTLAAV